MLHCVSSSSYLFRSGTKSPHTFFVDPRRCIHGAAVILLIKCKKQWEERKQTNDPMTLPQKFAKHYSPSCKQTVFTQNSPLCSGQHNLPKQHNTENPTKFLWELADFWFVIVVVALLIFAFLVVLFCLFPFCFWFIGFEDVAIVSLLFFWLLLSLFKQVCFV